MSKGRKMPKQRVGRGFFAIFVFLVIYTLTTPAMAQSFLGTIRGTVVDPQCSVVPGAAVMVVWRKTQNSGLGHVGFYAGEDDTA